MKKTILFSLALAFVGFCGKTQTYHEDDKEGLRAFLRQPSGRAGIINATSVLSTTKCLQADRVSNS